VVKFSVGLPISHKEGFTECVLEHRDKIAEVYFSFGDFGSGRSAQNFNDGAMPHEVTARQLEECYEVKFGALHIVGGGSRDSFLNELTAKKCGLPVIAGPTEATAIGNIAAQMLSLGDLKSVSDARKLVYVSFELNSFDA